MSFLYQEIHEQPAVIQTCLENNRATVEKIAQAIRAYQPKFVVIAARGTSDNAARYAQYLWGQLLRLPVMLATPSLHTLYQMPPTYSGGLVIGISQSGQAEDVNQVLLDAKQEGVLTLAITNNVNSLMAQTADYHIDMLVGEEKSVAATKTYTAQLLIVAMLGCALASDASLWEALGNLPTILSHTLALSESIPTWVERYRYMEKYTVIGRGYNFCTAIEINLKIKELCYLAGEGYSEADFLHGPIAVVGEGYPVLLVAPHGKTDQRMLDLAILLKARKAETLIVSNHEAFMPVATKFMRVPVLEEWLSPIVCVLPGQILAMSLASTHGYTLDRPRGLNKVTVTQ